ncbi:MAG TPA: hypothetical protein VFE24_00145, partial [Pirellulales bacterium]|nr:hypothetical protein [Pirellulales bacterium]
MFHPGNLAPSGWPRRDRTLCWSVLIWLPALLVGTAAVRAAAPTANLSKSADANSATWRFDQVELKDGRTIQGLIEEELDEFVEVWDVRRPPGKPMYLLLRTIERKQIREIRRLADEDRAALRNKLELYLHRAADEARRAGSLELTRQVGATATHFFFAGAPRKPQAKQVWFTLESTADDDATRRSIVRIEEAFVAFRQMFPPRVEPPEPPRFLILGTMEEYADRLRLQKLRIKNPAYYSPEQNLVVAGSDLTRYAEQLARTKQQHEKVRHEYAAVSQQMAETLKGLSQDLEHQAVAPEERKKILVAAQGSWDRELALLDKRIQAADRLNASLFNEVSGEMFARLYHEAFHAYLDNYLYPPQRYDVPRWLNEGLAQTFEAGLLEADTLRIDAPNT